MSAGEGGRPSVPHHMRVPTDRQRAVARGEADAEAATVREHQFQTDPAIAELLALVREPSGVSIETLLKVLALSSRQAVIAAKQDDKLRVDLGVGQITEKLDSMVGSAVGKRRRREIVSLVGFVASAVTAAALGVWSVVAPEAREAAEVAVIAPAIEAKRVAASAVEATDDHETRLAKVEATQREILAAIEKLNGAIVMVVDRLPEPEPTRVEVPSAIAKPRRKKGLDE